MAEYDIPMSDPDDNSKVLKNTFNCSKDFYSVKILRVGKKPERIKGNTIEVETELNRELRIRKYTKCVAEGVPIEYEPSSTVMYEHQLDNILQILCSKNTT